MAARGPLARDIPRGQRAFLHALMSAGSFDEDRTKLAFASALALDNEGNFDSITIVYSR